MFCFFSIIWSGLIGNVKNIYNEPSIIEIPEWADPRTHLTDKIQGYISAGASELTRLKVSHLADAVLTSNVTIIL